MAAPPPPAAWPRYFEDDHAPDDRRAALVDELIAFFTSDAGAAFLDGGAARAVGGIALALDHSALVAAAGSPDLVASLEVQPDEGLACLACAAHEVRGEGGGGGAVTPIPETWHIHLLNPAPERCPLDRAKGPEGEAAEGFGEDEAVGEAGGGRGVQ